MPLLESIDSLEEERFKKKHLTLILDLVRQLHFNREEVESILLVYYVIQKSVGPNEPGITIHQLHKILHHSFDLTEQEMVDRIIRAIDSHVGVIFSMASWVKMMSLFLRGTFQERVHHCFQVYEEKHSGFITRNRMVRLMRYSLITTGDDDRDEVVKDFVTILCSKMDYDRDGNINYDDFCTAVKKQPLLMECLGQCFPTRAVVLTFLTTFAPHLGKL